MKANLTVTKIEGFGPDLPYRIVMRPAHDGSHPAFVPGALNGELAIFVADPAQFPTGASITMTIHEGVTP